jgi:hypothetical protein
MRHFTVLPILLAAGLTFTAFAAQPTSPGGEAIITWSALNFYPSDYAAKALPANGSTVTASVEVARGGKLQDLRSVPVSWYLDGDWLSGGTGQKRTSFTVTKRAGDSHVLRAVAGLPDGDVEGTVSVPVAAREVVIETPYRNLAAPVGDLLFRAVPYFFNVTSLADLTFSWGVGGEIKSASGDNELTISTGGSAGTLSLSVTAQGVSAPLESASDSIQITVTR